MNNRDQEAEISRIRTRLAQLDAERSKLQALLIDLESNSASVTDCDPTPLLPLSNPPTITASSPTIEKVALFRKLFSGRTDVFPVRWENRRKQQAGYAPACANEWIKGICAKPRVKCGECPNQSFIPVSDEIIEKHLRGGDNWKSSDNSFVAGVYPMLPDETCWFLAADFDKEHWGTDALAVLNTCHSKGIPATLERSRSGNGSFSPSRYPPEWLVSWVRPLLPRPWISVRK
jgi:hypothetical protein